MSTIGGTLLTDLQNIQSELGYTADDTYLFNYKNKEKDLEKLLYKLSKYEKHCKLNNKLKTLKKKQKSLNKKKVLNKKKQKGGVLNENNYNSIFIPVIGGILHENNYIKLDNNNNLINELTIFKLNHIINILELFCFINIIYLYINNFNISLETIIVTFIIYISRIFILLYNKNNINKTNNFNNNANIEFNNFMVILLLGIPLFILLYYNEYYTLDQNLIITFMITILTIPYFRLIYNKLNMYDNNAGFYINLLEKLICGILLYIIILNNYDLNSIFKYLSNSNILENKNVNFNVIDKNILLKNFNKIFAK